MGHILIQRGALFPGALQAFIDALGQTGPHDSVVKHLTSKDFCYIHPLIPPEVVDLPDRTRETFTAREKSGLSL